MRPTITANSIGWAYLLHLSRPLGNLANARGQAQHYIGYADDPAGDGAGLERRIAEHLAGRGACLTRAAVAGGIELALVAAWRAPLAFEKVLKRRKYGPRICPLCCRARGLRPIAVAPPLAEQLALPLDLDADDLPPPPVRGMDGYEAWMLGQMRAARVRLAPLADDWDDGLL